MSKNSSGGSFSTEAWPTKTHFASQKERVGVDEFDVSLQTAFFDLCFEHALSARRYVASPIEKLSGFTAREILGREEDDRVEEDRFSNNRRTMRETFRCFFCVLKY